MQIYHQCGHNFVWNIQSLQDDGVGSGLIISPVNIEANRIADRIREDIRGTSFMDPQFYLPHDNKNKLATYPFFPSNVIDEFDTTVYEGHAFDVAKRCLEFQDSLGLKCLVIPTRYFEDLPQDHLEQLTNLFVDPFLAAKEELGLTKPLLLTLIAKPLHLESGHARDELLAWATGYQELTGIYLIFDNNFHSKQIKDPGYLNGVLRFLQTLRDNDVEVHVGYCGLEGLLYSVAGPTSVAVGSYENLRSFQVQRLESRGAEVRQAPSPRIFSGRLLQSIDHNYLPPLRSLVAGWSDLFDESPYKEFLINPDSVLNFNRGEIYKHYFCGFSAQIEALPEITARPDYLRNKVRQSLELFESISRSGVYLDPDSDGSHLPAWLNALAMYEKGAE